MNLPRAYCIFVYKKIRTIIPPWLRHFKEKAFLRIKKSNDKPSMSEAITFLFEVVVIYLSKLLQVILKGL